MVINRIGKYSEGLKIQGHYFKVKKWCQLRPRLHLGLNAAVDLVIQSSSSVIVCRSGTQNPGDLPLVNHTKIQNSKLIILGGTYNYFQRQYSNIFSIILHIDSIHFGNTLSSEICIMHSILLGFCQNLCEKLCSD